MLLGISAQEYEKVMLRKMDGEGHSLDLFNDYLALLALLFMPPLFYYITRINKLIIAKNKEAPAGI